jgi:alkylation response protein AidB-like acyl-CoA dehydrogenase
MTALSSSATDILRGRAADAEKAGRLHPDQLALIFEQQWFRMMAPRRYGGLALPLPEVVRLEEAISRADGSSGWTVTLCSGAGWFTGFFPPSGLDGIFADPQLCIAGSGMPAGRAHVIPGGYRIDGRWGYASGALHATAFTANCTVWSDGKPVSEEGDRPLIRPFLFLKEEVRIIRDWNPVGLVATGSHGFEVDGLEVTAARGFVIDGARAVDLDPLYRYPFLPLAEATLAANSSGMGLHFLDCCAAVFAGRAESGWLSGAAQEEMFDALTTARKENDRLREEFYAALDHSWATMQPESFQRVSRASHALAAGVRQWSDRLYPFAGLGAARVDSEINRVWRDLHTASQHPLLVFRTQ